MEGYKQGALIVSLLLLSKNIFVNGQTAEVITRDDKLHISNVKINTCCELDLDLPVSTCGKSRGKTAWTIPQHLMAENVSTSFPLKQNKITCKADGLRKISFPIISQGFGNDASQKFLKNGYLKVGIEYYPPAEFCVYGKNETELEVHYCSQDCTGPRPCIKKCCSLDKVYSFGMDRRIPRGCVAPKGDYFKPVFYNDYSTKSQHDTPDPFYSERYPSSFKFECAFNKTIFHLFPEQTAKINRILNSTFTSLTYRLRHDGKILFKYPDKKCGVMDPETVQHMCVDGAMNYGDDNQMDYVNNERELVMFSCTLPPEAGSPEQKKVAGILYGVTMFISSIFLLLTILTYAALWERQSVHGWTIVSHTVSLFFMYIFLGLAHVVAVTIGHSYLDSIGCVAIGVTAHYFFLATFCWLFLISVDLWLTFRVFTPRSGKRSKGYKRYTVYSIFGWGVPLIFVTIGIILGSKYREDECHAFVTPAYGKESCFVQQKAHGIYIYYPIAIMIGLNLIFFFITTTKLYMYRKSTRMATKDDKQAQFYRLFLKLFFVMGVLWIFEVISWATSETSTYNWYWVTFDLLNVLRALAVFIIFVCKRDIIFALEEKYAFLKPLLLPFAWLFNRRPDRGRDSESGQHSSIITRSSTLRQTNSGGKVESIKLVGNSNNK